MKARLATLLSLTGVLVAGSAAALVNSQVLRASDNVWVSDPLITLVIDSTAAPSTAVPPVVSSEVPTEVAEPAPASPVYQVGDAALVTLHTAGGVLTVQSVVPGENWAVVATRSIDATNIEVQLQRDSSVVVFGANLALGVVVTSVEVVEPAAPSDTPDVGVTTQPVAPGTTSAPITTPAVSIVGVPPTTDAAAAGPATTADDDSDGEPDEPDEPDRTDAEDEEEDD